MEAEIIQELLRKLDEMQSLINDMAHTISSQAETIEKLNATIAAQAETIEKMNATNAALLEKKNRNSNNSSKPPSSDGLNKKNRSLKQASGKKAGGQEGHKGVNFMVTDHPDVVKKHLPERCSCCPNREKCLANAAVVETRYVVDFSVQTVTTAHECCEVVCPMSQKTEIGSFPESIRAHMQYGNHLQALVAAFNTIGAVSVNRVHQILGSVFGIPLATGTVSNIVKRLASVCNPVVERIKETVIAAKVSHFDETGTRIDGKTKWVHTASTKDVTYLYLGTKRGKDGMEAGGVLPAFRGTAVHDCWSAYWKYGCTHAVCCAHLLRELNGVMENHPNQTWAKTFKGLLLDMKKAKESRQRKGYDTMSDCDLRKFEEAYDAALEIGFSENPIENPTSGKRGRPKKGKVRALIERLQKYKGSVCLFIRDFTVPFDNNQAERDIRNVKVKTKVSGCFRTDEGASCYLSIMSYVGTAVKQGRNPYTAILQALDGIYPHLKLQPTE